MTDRPFPPSAQDLQDAIDDLIRTDEARKAAYGAYMAARERIVAVIRQAGLERFSIDR